jgi:haloacid dehalogenase-like hydrolase
VANKGVVAERLSHYYQIPLEQIATLGDGANDVLMFRRSGLSIAMGNASEEVQRQATYVTASNEDEGFAKAIEEFILPRAVAAPVASPAGRPALTSPGLVIAGRWRAGSGAAGGGWPPAGPHRSGPAGQPSSLGERTAEQEFDLGVGAAQLVAGPFGQRVVDGGVQPQQDALAFGHRGSVPAVTGRGCRC